MAKPWARYEVGFINHPKFKLLSGNAIGLWLEGKNHADEHLTDGFLPLGVLKGFRFYSKPAYTALTTSIGQKDSTGEPYAPLWEPCDGGVMMHDYLEHNPTGEAIRARQDAAEERRKQERERKRQWRERKGERRRVTPVSGDMSHGTDGTCPDDATGQGRDRDALVPPMSRSNTDPDPEVPPNPPRGLLVESDLASVAGEFFERYPAVYAKARNGAFYRPKEARDFPTVLDLVAAYPDIDRLCLMAEVFLKRTDIGPKNVPGTIGQFAHMAPDCDAKLREHGR